MITLMLGTQVVGEVKANAVESSDVSKVTTPAPAGDPVEGVGPVEYRSPDRALAGMWVGSPASQMAAPLAVPTGALAVDVGAATVWNAWTWPATGSGLLLSS